MQWEYTIGQQFPTIEDVSNDRLYVQASLVSVAYRGRIQRGTFRFTTYGGVGSVGFLVAGDLRQAIKDCLGCEVRDFDLQSGSIPFPAKNSDRKLQVHTLSFSLFDTRSC